ncbi:stage II sporulation protein M [Halomicrobium salinisoli]|uniref:stage II sporulation protein M n=1 Tax=Halomicrobium salinisoli TaxID=2878391 RepID=UPI001CEFB884|nr:stage II sporulation protein M [Halomicrobium salinisoli]
MTNRVRAARGIARRWLRGYVLAAFATLLLGVVIGYALGAQVPAGWLQQGTGSSAFVPDRITFGTLLSNNLLAITFISLGAASAGALTAFALLLNGVLIGAVVQIALRETDLLTVLALIAPHGIVEIPALLIVSAIGYRFGHRTIRYVRGLEEVLFTRRDLKEAGVLYAVAALMIVVAAWIEAEVTLAVAERVADGAAVEA